MAPPKITICLPVYNGEAFLDDALRSLARQTFSGFRVAVSDNESTDRTSDILEAWKQRVPLDIARQAPRLSMIDNFNSLLDRVDTDYYMLLCHDDYLAEDDALAQAVAILDADIEISAIYCDLRYVDQSGRRLATRRFSRRGKISAERLGRQSIRCARNMFGIPLLIRAENLKSHRYDPELSYVCDIDLSWRISHAGPVHHIPDVLIANRFTTLNHTWGLLKLAGRQFKIMAAKHDVKLSIYAALQLWLINWSVMQQKRLFGIYARNRGRFS